MAGHQKPSLAAARRPNHVATSEITPRCAPRYPGAMVLGGVRPTYTPQAPGSTNSPDHHRERAPTRLRPLQSPSPPAILSSGSIHREIPFFNGITVIFPYCGHHLDDLLPLARHQVTGTRASAAVCADRRAGGLLADRRRPLAKYRDGQGGAIDLLVQRRTENSPMRRCRSGSGSCAGVRGRSEYARSARAGYGHRQHEAGEDQLRYLVHLTATQSAMRSS